MAKVNEQAVIQLIIKGEQSKATIKEVRTTMIGLERQLLNMKKADDPAGFEKLRKELEKVRAAHTAMINEVRGGAGSLKQFSLSWKDILGGVVGGNIATQAIQKLVSTIPMLIGKNGELSDSLADVSKQTGLTGDDLEGLNEDLNKIDTRTPVEELRKLAVIAGKLGFDTREDVLSFVKAADILNVALGEDLGGNVEEALNDIGKLVEIFGLEEEFGIEKSMLKVGSAINTVGASSAANEGYLVAWSKRFAGIAPNAGISIADTLGMAATMDILGQSSELSATNIGKMIMALGKDIPKFAKLAGMEVREFSQLLRTDGNEAFIRVLEGAKSTTKGVEGLVDTLEKLGIEGSEGAQVLGALTKNTDLLRQQQDITNASFEKGTSVIDEYNVKNENSAAILEKIGKVMTAWTEKAAASLDPLIRTFGRWFGVVSEMDEKMAELATQQNKVLAAESKLPGLIKRYDELSIKTDKTATESEELRKIMAEIAEVVPGAAYEFDQYGNVLGVDIGLVQEFIIEQRRLLDTMRSSRKEEIAHDKEMLQRRAARLKEMMNRGTVREQDTETGSVFERKMRADEIVAGRKELAEIEKQRLEIVKKERELSGIADRAAGRASRTVKTKENEIDNSPVALSEEQKKKAEQDAKKALEDRKRLNDDLLKNQQQLTLATMKEQQKELQAAEYKYEELRKRAHGHAAEIAKINEQQAQEIGQINDKYNKKYLGDFDKTIRGQLKFLNNQSKEENEYQQKRADDRAKRADKELFEINDHYLREIALAKSKGESIVALETLWRAEVEKLNADRNQKETDAFLSGIFDSYRSELAIAEENGASKEDIVRSHLERLRLLREEYGALDVEQQKKVNREIAKTDRDLLAIRLDNVNKTGEAMRMGGQVISDVLSLAANNQSEYAEFQKALGLFQIAIESGTAVAAAVTAGTKGDGYTIALRIATAIAAVTSGMLKAKELMAEAEQPSTPASREDGGFTDIGSIYRDRSGNPEGWVSRPTLFDLGPRSYIAGEGYKAEYVLSSAMLKDPAIADFVGGVEALRQQRHFENGGSTAMPAKRSTSAPVESNAEVVMLLRAILAKEGNWNYSFLEKYTDDLDNIRSRASA